MENKLANNTKNSNALTKSSLLSSVQMATEMLTLACVKFGKELTTPEASSWLEILGKHPPGAIESAFKEFFRTPPAEGQRKWFPEEWEILELMRKWGIQQAESTRVEEQRLRDAEDERRRAAGEKSYSFNEICAVMREALDGFEARNVEVMGESREKKQAPPIVIRPERREQLRQQVEQFKKRPQGETA